MTKKFEIVASVGSWKSEDGKKHKRTLAIGAIFESKNGHLVARIDAMPTSPEWSGWLQLKPVSADAFPKPSPTRGRKLPRGMPAAPDPTPDSEDDDDAPF